MENWKSELGFSHELVAYRHGLDGVAFYRGSVQGSCVWEDKHLPDTWGHVEEGFVTLFNKKTGMHDRIPVDPYRAAVLAAYAAVAEVREALTEGPQDFGGLGLSKPGPSVKGWKCQPSSVDYDRQGNSYSQIRDVWSYVPDIEGLTAKDRRDLIGAIR